jgi:exosortase
VTTLHASKTGRTDAASAPADQRILGLFTADGLAASGLLLAGFGWLFYRWFYTQHLISMERPADWGHAYFVPLISGYMIWQSRAKLAQARVEPFWPGLAPLLLGVMAYFFFVATRFPGGHMVQGWALIVTLLGLVLLVGGPEVARWSFLPIAFLVFGVTISEMVMIELTFRLQLIASYGAWVILSAVGFVAGFSCDVGGNAIRIVTSDGRALPPLNVAEACSGMRMVIAFFALAGATALLGCRHWWQRAAVMILAAPISVLVNIGRVAVLGLLSLLNPDLSAGQAHTLIGTLLLIPGLGLFLLAVWALNRAVEDGPADKGATS